jgi:hypothetical protein
MDIDGEGVWMNITPVGPCLYLVVPSCPSMTIWKKNLMLIFILIPTAYPNNNNDGKIIN